MPEMNVGFEVRDGKPNLITPAHINLGLAIDAYTLRHSFGTWHYQTFGDIKATQQIMRHKSIRMTERYVRAAVAPVLQQSVDALDAAVAGLRAVVAEEGVHRAVGVRRKARVGDEQHARGAQREGDGALACCAHADGIGSLVATTRDDRSAGPQLLRGRGGEPAELPPGDAHGGEPRVEPGVDHFGGPRHPAAAVAVPGIRVDERLVRIEVGRQRTPHLRGELVHGRLAHLGQRGEQTSVNGIGHGHGSKRYRVLVTLRVYAPQRVLRRQRPHRRAAGRDRRRDERDQRRVRDRLKFAPLQAEVPALAPAKGHERREVGLGVEARRLVAAAVEQLLLLTDEAQVPVVEQDDLDVHPLLGRGREPLPVRPVPHRRSWNADRRHRHA